MNCSEDWLSVRCLRGFSTTLSSPLPLLYLEGFADAAVNHDVYAFIRLERCVTRASSRQADDKSIAQ